MGLLSLDVDDEGSLVAIADSIALCWIGVRFSWGRTSLMTSALDLCVKNDG